MKLKELVEKYGEYDVILSHKEATKEIIIEGRKPESKTVFDLKDDDIYFGISNAGEIWRCRVNFLSTYQDQLEIGNVCLTQKDAENERERRKVETLLLMHGGRRWFKEHKPNWFIALENEVEDKPHAYNATSIPKQGCIYFDSEEQAQKAIEEIGTDRIKKALFEVR